MGQSAARRLSLPIVSIACLILFLGYLLLTTGAQTIHCQQSRVTTAQCESVQAAGFGLLPYATRPFPLATIEVASELTDRVPRGGVRFHHTLTLSGTQGQFSTELTQSPLAGSAIKTQIQDFLTSTGTGHLIFQHFHLGRALARTGLMAFLLSIVSWSFWDVRWPQPAAQRQIGRAHV